MSKHMKEYKPSTLITMGYEWLSAAISAVVVVAILFSGILRIVNVSGRSMEGTLHDGDRLMLSNLFYEPDYGDIVVILRENNNTPLIKRVIGLPGDSIRIDEVTGQVYRNGELLNEPYISGVKTEQVNWREEREIPEDMIFVMGDNRNPGRSDDSRGMGALPMRNVVGKVLFRLSPDIGFITNGE